MALKAFVCAITAESTLDCIARDLPVTVTYQTQEPNAPVVIYNSDMKPVADLQYAYHIRYKKQINKLWSASFYLPFDDTHASKVTLRRFAELYDGTKRIGLFRIVDRKLRRLTTRKVYQYTCEHVLSTLNDDMLVGVHNATGNTTAALNVVLGRQSTTRWVLGTCDWANNYVYRWEDKSLLEALLEIPKRLGADYQFTFSTTSYPWTINLVSPSSTVTAYIDYSRNLQQISREEDTKDMYTRLYAWGQGVQGSTDQIDLTSANPTGKTYIDSDTIGTYGVIARVWTDQRYTTSATLYAAAVQKLALRKDPLYRYSVKAADIYQLTGEDIDNFSLGSYVLITDEELDIDVSTRVVAIGKPDITGKPGSVTLQLANKLREFVDVSDVVYATDLDSVKDGSAFARVLSTSIDAGVIKLSAVPGGTMGSFPSPPEIAGLYLGATHLGYHDGSNWKTFMDADGNFYLGGTGGKLQWDAGLGTLTIDGSITATTGEIGGWIIGTHTLTADSGAVGLSSEATGGVDWRIWAGNATPASAPFRVDESGNMVASAATITGAITASSGTIGGWTIAATTLTAGTGGTAVGIAPGTYPFYAGNATAASAPFRVTNAGALVATSATITGAITASSGTIGGFTIGASTLTAGAGGTAVGIAPATYPFYAGSATAASAPFRVSNAGALVASSATITGSITISSGSGVGNLSDAGDLAERDTVNGTYIDANSIATGHVQANAITATEINVTNLAAIKADLGAITAGSMNIGSGVFTVSAAGVMTASSATISGAITASSGTIGGFTVNTTEGLYAGSGATRVQMKAGAGFWAGATAQGSAPFQVTAAGALTATGATISGAITSSSLTVTGGTISAADFRTAGASSSRAQITSTAGWGGTQHAFEVYTTTTLRAKLIAGGLAVYGSSGNAGGTLESATYGVLQLSNASGTLRVRLEGDDTPYLNFAAAGTVSSGAGCNLTIASGNNLLLTSASSDDITLTSGDDILLNVADAGDALTIYDWVTSTGDCNSAGGSILVKVGASLRRIKLWIT